ncbi:MULTISPECIES: urea transporter [unclassified Chelatococcus]|uniref:urea transporter n=1 Tax=unclassified Chelatococcus TaxID=2638111 RepID=UPI001BCCFB94|nr:MULTISPECIES: urea transporter [unclassified Chelatococcus]CAH1668831.1 Eukaryotic-type low-affinity urea transporter [Hyphomicrobiales bacterium]MBS7738127.1 urea transporter [Chelatococcus sp. HY11]MBX3546926.1 urea transporter [Chelatococcus sp.]MCO5077527.1 urea transporter [Chelatococcus sp.]CAH1678942.1 Eukaryotic-type low-affinity urea transporter [Hyphomicrobiales bacterium]
MAEAISTWSTLASRHAALRFIDINLRGAGQVIFQNNPLTGLLFILAIAWGAYTGGQLDIIIGAVVALVIATVTAMVLEADETSLNQGLFGFNGILVGAAVPTFLADGAAMWFILVVGAAVSTVVMLAISKVMKTWETPALTFPFVLTTWFLVLAAYSFGQLPIASMGPPALPHATASAGAAEALSLTAVLEAWLKGPAQVFLINNPISGVVVLLGLFVSSPWAAFFAAAGAAVALAVSLGLGASIGDITAGLYGFSPVLTAVALGCVFYNPSLRVAAFALLGTIFTVIVQGALDAGIAPFGVPTFTAPFVFVTWLFLLPKSDLQPHPHAPIKGGILSSKSKP